MIWGVYNMSEKVEGYIPVYKDKTKLFRGNFRYYYTLFVTTNRIIGTKTFTRISRGKYQHPRMYLSKDSVTARAYFEKINELSPEELLVTDEDNFVIPRELIDRIILKKTRGHDNEIKIHTTKSDEHKFSFNPEFLLPDVQVEDKKEQENMLKDKFDNYLKFIENSFPDIVENKL